MKLTIARINAAQIPPDKAEIKLWDGAVNGLCLRIRLGGSRSWAYRYRSGGGRSAKIRTLKLGSYPALSIDAARAAAKACAAQVAGGHDPAAVRHESRRREKATLGKLLAVDGPYERALKARHIGKRKGVLSSLRRGLVRLMNTDIAKLNRLDFVEALAVLKDQPGAQADFRKHSRGLLEWAVNSGLVQANVLAGMRMPPKTRAQRLEETSRRRALDDDDITRLWRAAEVSSKFGSLVQFGLLTGMRRGELASLCWSSIHTDRIVLPAAVTKTSAEHQIPLTDPMRVILASQSRTTSPLVFPSNTTGRAMTGWVKMKARLLQVADIGDWVIHDLRRTCRTLMSRLGVPEPIAELAIGHIKGSLIGIYDLDTQWSGRVDAFERVSAHIARLIAVAG